MVTLRVVLRTVGVLVVVLTLGTAPALASSTTLTFDTVAAGSLIQGDYGAPVVATFPSDHSWIAYGSYGPDVTTSIGPTHGPRGGGPPVSLTFTAVGANILTGFDIVTGTSDAGSFQVSCTGNNSVSDNLVDGSQITYFTGWTTACTSAVTVTLTASARALNFAHLDNLTFSNSGGNTAVLGNNTVGTLGLVAGNSAGTASSFSNAYVAVSSSNVDTFNLWLDSGTTPQILQAGLYLDAPGSGNAHNPGLLSRACNMAVPATLPAWGHCLLGTQSGPASITLTAGATYWMATWQAGPTSSGSSEVHYERNGNVVPWSCSVAQDIYGLTSQLSGFPSPWPVQTNTNSCSLSDLTMYLNHS